MCPLVTVVSESTESILVVEVLPVVSIITEQIWTNTIPVTSLWSLVPEETREAYVSGKKTDTAPVLDLLPLGYSKVLGKGRIPQIPIVVRARWFSKEAERKIKEAGGVVELVA
ncbi:large subunit ribosomal protein L27Ae [Cladophialophora psammophila CBS 110553]|uniref:Large subunit ribosomal protein L27Ae n=1 Tax=Cladophialophora psammophila CBS 110553 TaxID=1182543 RepID=W9WRA4_9EURO|nr:large subunit ribosomal protein L27Ae [Cladophialophora psammophila CBS 110553]EXJ67211.1 large subunit ribosomal protein L27Ae [Cladophialophora psammophila CBS 110553]